MTPGGGGSRYPSLQTRTLRPRHGKGITRASDLRLGPQVGAGRHRRTGLGAGGAGCYMSHGRLLTSTTEHLEAGHLHRNLSRRARRTSSEPAAPSPGKRARAPTCAFLRPISRPPHPSPAATPSPQQDLWLCLLNVQSLTLLAASVPPLDEWKPPTRFCSRHQMDPEVSPGSRHPRHQVSQHPW